VSDLLTVQVVESLDYLFEEPPAGGLLDLSIGALLLDVLVERDALDVVGDDADLPGCLDEVVHFDDVGVVDLLQSHDLPLHCFLLHVVIQLGLLVNLNGELLSSALVVTSVHLRIGSLPYRSAKLVILQLALLGFLLVRA
jgi:hypothetical protein